MTDTTTLDLLRRLDPLDMGTTAELDPDGASAHRVRAAAIAAAQQPGLATHRPRRAPRHAPRLAAGATAVAALATVALAIGLPGGGGDSPTRPGPASARAALVSAAERTSAFTSGHIVWHWVYDHADPDIDLKMTNEVRYDGSDVDITGTSSVARPTRRRTRGRATAIALSAASRTGAPATALRAAPGRAGRRGLRTRRGSDPRAGRRGACRRGPPRRRRPADRGRGRHAVHRHGRRGRRADQFRPPFRRTVPAVTITATVGDNGAVSSLALRAPGEAVDVTFGELGQPQSIVAP